MNQIAADIAQIGQGPDFAGNLERGARLLVGAIQFDIFLFEPLGIIGQLARMLLDA
jgi:hypothetical protein